MLPQYSTIPNQDNEKQPIQGYSCPCAAANHHQCNNQKRKPSKFAIITLGVLGFIFLGHMFDSHDHHHYRVTGDQTIEIQMSDDFNEKQYTDQGWDFHCYGNDFPNIPWDGKSVYDALDNSKGLTLNHVKTNFDLSNVFYKSGKIIIAQNSELNQPRVTFDIKVSNNNLKNAIQIKESKSSDDFKLVLQEESNGYQGCLSINALVEVPKSNSLQDISFDLLNNDIIVEDELKLSGTFKAKTTSGNIRFQQSVTADVLDLSTKSGDVAIKKVSSAPTIDLSTKSGDARGVFDLVNGNFKADVISGDIKVEFNSITPVSTITAESISGDVDIKLPSDFESRFDISTKSGETKVKAKNTNDLHLTNIGRRRKSVEGYYGNAESSPNVIKATAKSGDVTLKYD